MPKPTTGMHWWLRLLAAVLLVMGAYLLTGGIYLLMLGGTWYYVIAGIGLLASGWQMWKGRLDSIYIFLALLVFTFGWTCFEAGQRFWAWVPRMATPLAIAIAVLFSAPLLPDPAVTRRVRLWTRATGALGAAVLAAFIAAMFFPHGIVRNDMAVTPGAETARTLAMGDEWREYGRTGEGVRYSPLDQITRDNIGKLEVVWTARHGQVPDARLANEDQNTPIFADGTLYHCAYNNVVSAFDGTTGALKWRFDPEAAAPVWMRCRSLAYVDPAALPERAASSAPAPVIPPAPPFSGAGRAPEAVPPAFISPESAGAGMAAPGSAGADCGPRIVMATADGRLIAVRAADGTACDGFGDGGVVDLRQGMGDYPPGQYMPTTGAVLAGDRIVVGGWVKDNQSTDEAPGVVRAYDALTGELSWAWDSGNPDIDKLPPEGETYTLGTPNVWAPPSYDADLNMVYLPTGNPSPDYWGGARSERDDEYSSSVVAVDLDTGREVWHFQTVRHDLWDYDVPSQPALVEFPQPDGSTVPALVQLTKRGQIFVLDRRNGTPLTEVEERPAPQGDAEGERYAPTQPYSVGMPQIGTDPAMMKGSRAWGMTPLDHLYCRIRNAKTRWDGLLTPPSTEPYFEFPGNTGGFNWGSASFDQSRNLLVLNDLRWQSRSQLIPQEQAQGLDAGTVTEAGPMQGTPYQIKIGYNTLKYLLTPCFEPPYGTVTAIDLASRQIRWQVPMGTTREVGPFGIKTRLPLYPGMPTLGGLLTTRPGLSFFAGTQDYFLRAIDTETGQVVWKDALPVGSQSVPITYLDRNGRQVIVVSAAGARLSPDRGDYLIAYALGGN
ncbi:membrane-bound PQQ-dependent dehydrogenase, glucose/quinate/shikimate family [Tropicimonas sp.]|uniref:membrane-bound PQQ-dependent dehydrogenase, glucose/quinate/shikimate family n=1 Tax=Tropicimonas sp. TaxID=2067044 RepID=UPI003A88D061